jgi:hypothetical protein
MLERKRKSLAAKSEDYLKGMAINLQNTRVSEAKETEQ